MLVHGVFIFSVLRKPPSLLQGTRVGLCCGGGSFYDLSLNFYSLDASAFGFFKSWGMKAAEGSYLERGKEKLVEV